MMKRPPRVKRARWLWRLIAISKTRLSRIVSGLFLCLLFRVRWHEQSEESFALVERLYCLRLKMSCRRYRLFVSPSNIFDSCIGWYGLFCPRSNTWARLRALHRKPLKNDNEKPTSRIHPTRQQHTAVLVKLQPGQTRRTMPANM